MEAARPYHFTSSGDSFGWSKGTKTGAQHLMRCSWRAGGWLNKPGHMELKTALREIAAFHTGEFRLTGNQNLVIANIDPKHRTRVQQTLEDRGAWAQTQQQTALRLSSLACVALNTCSLAFAEAERYLPHLIDRLDQVIQANGLTDDGILIRMTGCPNGCARPYLGEIGLVGRALGRYNLYLGADHAGERLNKLHKEMLDEEGILQELTPLLEGYAARRAPNERFGDFVVREGHVRATTHGQNFHD